MTTAFTSALTTALTTKLLGIPGILAPLQGLFHRLSAGARPSRCARQPARLQKSLGYGLGYGRGDGLGDGGDVKSNAAKLNAINLIANYAIPMGDRGINGTQIPVLRIMRVLEAGQAPASVGRMVISGRMADVCAELDRLAAREAARH